MIAAIPSWRKGYRCPFMIMPVLDLPLQGGAGGLVLTFGVS